MIKRVSAVPSLTALRYIRQPIKVGMIVGPLENCD